MRLWKIIYLNLPTTLRFLVVSSCENAEKLQKDLITLNEWNTEWPMILNTDTLYVIKQCLGQLIRQTQC